MQMLFKHYRTKDFVSKIKQIARSSLFTHTIEQIGHTYLRDVLNYMLYSRKKEHSLSAEALTQALTEAIPNQREVIMTLGEELEQKGQHEKALSIAKNMLDAGVDLALIKKVTELSEEEMATLTTKH